MGLCKTWRVELRAATILVALVSGSAATSKTVTVSQTSLEKAMNAAGPGDTLVLKRGGYGVVVVPRKSWQTPITIDARDATVAGVVIRGASGVNWVGGAVVGSVYGIWIRQSSRVEVRGADVSKAARGIVVASSTDVKLIKNKLHDLRTDGIDVVGQRVLVEGNTIDTMSPIKGDHPDGVQIWSADDMKSRDITVRNNKITGRMQGVFARSTKFGLENIVITGNRVLTTYQNGILLQDTKNSVLTGNVVKALVTGANRANIRSSGTGNTVCGNVVPDVPRAPAAQPCAGG